MKVEVGNQGQSYSMTAAVLIYTDTGSRHAFATRHFVDIEGGQPRIKPGTPLSVADYISLVRALSPKDAPGMRWNDTRILASGLGRLIWWTPPQKRSMFFSKSSANTSTFSGNGCAALPGLVFMATTAPAALYVYAFRGADVPTAETQLCQAPLFNVWSRGKVCQGNALFPKDAEAQNPDPWMQGFFGSRFSHPNFTQKDRLILGMDPTDFWKTHLASGADVFPEERLVDIPLTVGDLAALDYAARLEKIKRADGEF